MGKVVGFYRRGGKTRPITARRGVRRMRRTPSLKLPHHSYSSEHLRELPIVVAAKVLRQELKEKYPNQSFSVRVDRYSLGEAIDISYVNGPSSIKIDAIAQKYERVDRDPATGEILAGGNRYVQVQRKITDDIREREYKNAQVNPNDYREYSTVWHKISSTDYPPGN